MTVFAFIIIYLATLAAIFVWLVRQEYKLPTIACGDDKDRGHDQRLDRSSDTGGHF